MAKIILHKEGQHPDAIAERRLQENFLLSPLERFKKTFQLMSLAAAFKQGPIKHPQGLGIVLKRKTS
jgi:hypothetical protein